MTRSITSTFGEPEDSFATAMRAEGFNVLLITGRGEFRAKLIEITLHSLRLSAVEERLARIAFIAVPAGTVRISFPIGNGNAPVCDGIRLQRGEMLIFAPDEQVHVRTDGECRWGSVWVPVRELARYGSALMGCTFAIPAVAQRLQPPPAAGRSLRSHHAAAIRMAQTRPEVLLDRQTAHGLEQELIEALVLCLSAGSDKRTEAAERGRDIMVRFEELIAAQTDDAVRVTEICVALGVSERLLRSLCATHLGMSPISYARLRRLSLVRRALQHGGGEATSVMYAARRYGFYSPARFAANYRAAFDESPATTLRRGSNQDFRLRRPHSH
jgi:AraC-like DNA-binding protein